MAEKTLRQKLEDFLHEETFFNGLLAKAEAKTKVNRLFIFLGLIGVFAIWLVFGFAINLFVNVLGFVYPSYRSAKAVETQDKKDDSKWLTYWVVFSFFAVFDYFADFIMQYFPIYYLVKMMLLAWCMVDYSWSGSTVIYNKIIRRVYLRVCAKASLKEESYRVPPTQPEDTVGEDTTDPAAEDKKDS